MNFLSNKGMKLAKPVRAVDGLFVVEIFDVKKYFAVIFEKATGKHLSDEDVSSEELLLNWGQYLGRMHHLTKSYHVPAQIKMRQPWNLDESLAMALRSLDKSDSLPFLRLNELMEWLQSLPKNPNCYGLVHCDLHRGNFFIESNQLTAFDG
jgi:amicoumacin kinase